MKNNPMPPALKLPLWASFLLSCLMQLSAQTGDNLVLNPSFETIRADKTLERSNDLDVAEHWSAPNASEPLLFTTINSAIYDPNGSSWPFKARTGQNVAGINVKGGALASPRREYIQGSLKRPLAVGKKYYFSFYVHYHCEGANNIGIVFLPEKLAATTNGLLNLKPASYQKEVTPYNNTTKTWALVRDSFIAYMPFQYFIIGNFFTNEETKVEATVYEHYFAYIDDIEVTESSEAPAAIAANQPDESAKWRANVDLAKNMDKAPVAAAPEATVSDTTTAVIFFGFDSARIQPEFAQAMDAVIAKISNNPLAQVVLTGYTSSEGSKRYNKQLSQRRASAVSDYLTKNGVSSTRIQILAGGEKDSNDGTVPLVARQQNRRVEIRIR